MALNLFQTLCFFLTIFWITSESADVAPELYWKSKLPNVPIPKVIKNLLPDSTEYKANFEIVNGNDHIWRGYYYTEEWKRGVDATTLHENPDLFFFFEHDLSKGKKMALDLKDAYFNRFLPRDVADSIPFSTNHFDETLNRFSVTPGSPESKVLKKTLERCEMHGREDMVCATSLESMVDFVETEIGNDAAILSNEKTEGEYRVQDYTVAGQVRKVFSSNGIRRKP